MKRNRRRYTATDLWLEWQSGTKGLVIMVLLFVLSACSNPASAPLEGELSQLADAGNVVTFTLINADTNQPIVGFDPIPAGTTLNLATLPTKNLNIRANTNPAKVGSVRFAFGGKSNYRTENSAPYALASDKGGDYYAWTPPPGAYTLKATPYSGRKATGTKGTPLTLKFNVVSGNTSSGVTSVSIQGERWLIDGQLTHPGTRAEGMLLNSRMVNATFDDANAA
ncbi:MAG: hypothetical protein M3511_16195, partial [Deinococcota bacterium]|nr:hypothetical protein [Deinococcota bacterium]